MTEFCAGGNLWNAIKNDDIKVKSLVRDDTHDSLAAPENMPLLDIPFIARDVAQALAYLHEAGFAHRDVKSSNVLLSWCPESRRIRAKLCDFGSAAPVAKMPRRPAKPQWGGLEKFLGFSGQWQPVGTMLWMAPEMLEPPLEGSPPPIGYSGDKVDVYSLGIVLWELLTWRVPWAGGEISKQEVLDSVVRRGERLPIPDDCSESLGGLISSMWAASPNDRPEMSVVAYKLEQIGLSWDVSGHFSAAANTASAQAENVLRLLSDSIDEKMCSEGLHMGQKDTDASDAESLPRSYEGKSVDVSISQSRGSLDVDSQSDEVCQTDPGLQQYNLDETGDGSVLSKVTSQSAVVSQATEDEPSNWFGEVGEVDVEDLGKYLVPMLFSHVYTSIVSNAEAERVGQQRSRLAELESRAEELRMSSKLDPFAAFTADAKIREAKQLRKSISLESAENNVNAWRATRDFLREQLVEAEAQHLEWRRKYREISRER